MDASIAAVRLLALSQVLLFSIAVLLFPNLWRVRAVLCGLGISVQAYLLAPLLLAAGDSAFANSVGVVAALCPWLLLLAVEELFEDRRRLLPWLVVGLVYVVVILLDQVRFEFLIEPAVASYLGQLFRFGFVLLALVLLWRGRRDDLVEGRLRARTRLLLVISIASLTVLIVESVFTWKVPVGIELAGMIAIALLALGINLAFWRYNPGFNFAGLQPVLNEAHTAAAETDPLLASLQSLMEHDRLYAEHDLRIAGVAARLNVQEYRLRRAINQTLGYRNFNRYINDFRLREASARLLSQPDLPILSIALDVGFRSISSFNSAFREANGCSPSEYRAIRTAGN